MSVFAAGVASGHCVCQCTLKHQVMILSPAEKICIFGTVPTAGNSAIAGGRRKRFFLVPLPPGDPFHAPSYVLMNEFL